MNDILHRILELSTMKDKTVYHDASYKARLARIRDLVKSEIQAEAACRNTLLDYEFIDDDKTGTWFIRFRTQLACWIAP